MNNRVHDSNWKLSNHRNLLVGSILSIAFFGFICWSVPLKDAFQFDPDEGCELLKGFMCSNGFSLYKDMWNDQPPLYTFLLSTLFKLFGPTLFGARILAVGFGTLLFFCFHNIVAMRSGIIGAVVGVIFLLVSPCFLNLCVSVMLEVPAFGTALLAVWLLFIWRERQHKSLLLISGLIMGCAMQIKLTAGMIVPAMLAEIFLAVASVVGRSKLVAVLQFAGMWFTGFCMSFITIGILSGERILPMWRSHTSLGVHGAMGDPLDLRLSIAAFDQHFEALVCTVLGIAVILLRKQWRQMAFPIVLLLTAVAVHLFHRPYWYYYYLHLLLPMVWLSGHAVAEMLKSIHAQPIQDILGRKIKILWFAIIGACLLLLLLIEGGSRFYLILQSLAAQPRVQDDELLKKILEYRQGTRWFYSDEYIYSFHARICVPPAIVVLPLKRYWSGQIDEEGVLDWVIRYQPDQVLISPSHKLSTTWETSAGADYVMSYDEGGYRLFVSKKLGRDLTPK